MASNLPGIVYRSVKADGTPNALGLVYTYAAGTSTAQAAYTSASLATPLSNPFPLGADGCKEVWLDPALTYRFVEKTAAGVAIPDRDVDQISGTASSADLAAASGSSIVGFVQDDPSAIARTVQEKLRETTSVFDYMTEAQIADAQAGTMGYDLTSAVQAALTAASIDFPEGATYRIDSDILMPSNRKIWVKKGATVVCNGHRWTAYSATPTNVEIQCDGWIKSVGIVTGAEKSGWPGLTNGYDVGPNRGFIEFGSSTVNSADADGFWVHGTGKISGDWTGTPRFDSGNQVDVVNSKGIGAWNCKNVLVEGIEVFGFKGEQVFAWGISTDQVNVCFRNIYSHDGQFSCLNFNVWGPYKGWRMYGNVTVNGYTGIEASGGAITNNTVYTPYVNGLMTGSGGGSGPILWKGNLVKGAGSISYYAAFGSVSPIAEIDISDNRAVDSGTIAYALDYCQKFTLKGNTSTGHATTSSAYAYNVNHSSDGVIHGNETIAPGTHSLGDVYVDPTCTDTWVGVNPTPTDSAAAVEYWAKRSGTFTPVPTNLTVVNGTGGASYQGFYDQINGRVYGTILVNVTGTATTASNRASPTSWAGLPIAAAHPATCHAVDANVNSYGVGLVSGSTVYTPTWAAVNAQVVVTFDYPVA